METSTVSGELLAELLVIKSRIRAVEEVVTGLCQGSMPEQLELQDVLGDELYDELWQEAKGSLAFGLSITSMSYNDLFVLVGYNVKRGRYPTHQWSK